MELSRHRWRRATADFRGRRVANEQPPPPFERGEVDAERRRADAGPMMPAVSLRDDAKDRHPAYHTRDPEAPVSNPIVREDVCGDVERAPNAEANKRRTSEDDERRRGPERPQPEQVIPYDPPGGRVRVVRLVLAPERPMEDEAVDE